MTRQQSRIVVAIIVLALVVVLAAVYWQRNRIWSGSPAGEPPKGANAGPPARTQAAPRSQPVAPPAPVASRRATVTERDKALAMLKDGTDLLAAEKPLAARAALADALVTGALPARAAQDARAKLAELAYLTIFSPKPLAGDPCTQWYRFRVGDVLVAVERQLKLRVPAQLMLKINSIEDARRIRAGQRLKMIRGPFHAVISKSRFTMDMYLEEPKTRRMIFVRRLGVGIGKDGSTPVGRWRVASGGKLTRAAWTPPHSSGIDRRKVLWGQEDYPLGAKGYWISLEGIEETPYTKADGYGIHGTNDRSSIGRAVSLGCIRLSDDDIELVFFMLYEKWSTVTIVE